ncbi:MAG: ice-binding family protein [Microbacteriaceae bacterium]
MARTTPISRRTRTVVVLGVAAALALTPALAAQAATVIDGPIGLGDASGYAVLAGSTVTNTGPSVVNGDVGLSPGTSIVGFDGGPGRVEGGTLHAADEPAALAQAALTNAYGVADSLTPQESGIIELNGRTLEPGVYSGDAVQLADTGALTFDGSEESVWVIRADSTLTIGGGTTMTFSGGASACNVFWQVGSSATIGSAAQFRGTVLAQTSITATTGATIIGRLLAQSGAVTLDTNLITVPEDCPAPGSTSETDAPAFTSGTPSGATAGTPYSFTVTASGTPAPSFTVTSGTLPPGLILDGGSGVISGTPTTPGSTTVTITADNGQTPPSRATYTIPTAEAAVVPPPTGPGTPSQPGTPAVPGAPTAPGTDSPPTAPAVPGSDSGRDGSTERLAATGSETAAAGGLAALALLAGLGLLVIANVRRHARSAGNGS